MQGKEHTYVEFQRYKTLILQVVMGLYSIYLTYVTVKQIFFNIPFDLILLPNFVLGCLWFMFAVATPFIFYWMYLEIIVSEKGIFYKYFPFHKTFQKIEFADIEKVEMREYRPLREFGGWGIRLNPTTNAMTVSGNKGLEFTLKNQKKKLLLGTQKPDEFYDAVLRFVGKN